MRQNEVTVESVHAGSEDDLSKTERDSIRFELDGVAGDAHRSYSRKAWGAGDKQAKGTLRRNERQWSAVSVEELKEISDAMGLVSTLKPEDLGANLCFRNVRQLSRLPKGSVIQFPSGAELIVVEYNPPCLDMGKALSQKYAKKSGRPPEPTEFPKAAKLTRGIVGVVDVPGEVRAGDTATIRVYEPPAWLVRASD